MSNKWSDEEVEYLEINYEKLSIAEMSVEMNRDISDIKSKILFLGIKKRRNRIWSPAEDQYLIINYDRMTSKELALMLLHKPGPVRMRAAKLGLKKTTGKGCNKITNLPD